VKYIGQNKEILKILRDEKKEVIVPCMNRKCSGSCRRNKIEIFGHGTRKLAKGVLKF